MLLEAVDIAAKSCVANTQKTYKKGLSETFFPPSCFSTFYDTFSIHIIYSLDASGELHFGISLCGWLSENIVMQILCKIYLENYLYALG